MIKIGVCQSKTPPQQQKMSFKAGLLVILIMVMRTRMMLMGLKDEAMMTMLLPMLPSVRRKNRSAERRNMMTARSKENYLK